MDGNKIGPIYILSGDDYYSKEKFIKKIESEIKNKHGDCEKSVLDSDSISVDEVKSQLSTASLFSKGRIVIVKNADSLFRKKFKSFLNNYIRKKNPASIGVFETERVPGKVKDIQVKKFRAPYESKMPSWIKNEVKEKGKAITYDAAKLLTFYCGRNLHNTAAEIDKIFTAYPFEESYGIKHVRNIAASHKKDDIFGFLDALVDRDKKKALLLLDNILRYGQPGEPIKITSMIKWKMQQIIGARALTSKGASEREIIKSLNLKPAFLYKGFCRKINRFSLNSLYFLYDKLCKLDISIKSSTVDEKILLEEFIFRFLQH